MGSDFVSIGEAAKMLKRSKRTIITYLKNGMLRREREGRSTVIPKSDVEALITELGVDLPPMNRQTLFQLVARVQRLEVSVAVLKRATGIGAVPLRPSRDEALGLKQAAEHALASGSWTVEELHMWADMFERMDEVFFDILGVIVSAADSWRPFYELCVAQVRFVEGMEGFSGNLSLQQLHDRLRLHMKSLRAIVLAWIELGGGHAELLVSPSEDILRRLSAKGRSSLG